MNQPPDLGLLDAISLQPDGRSPSTTADQADTVTYDNYFRIKRQTNPAAWAHAAQRVASDVLDDLPSTSLDDGNRLSLMTGINKLLLAASLWIKDADDIHKPETREATPTDVKTPVLRWKVGHHLFHLLLSLMNSGSDEVIAAFNSSDWDTASSSLLELATLLDSSTATMHYASDFPRSSYEEIIRPSMEPPWMPPGFSGVFNQDHAILRDNLKKIRLAARDSDTTDECQQALKTLWRTQSRNRRDHRMICEQFVPGGDSLLQQHFNKNNEGDGN